MTKLLLSDEKFQHLKACTYKFPYINELSKVKVKPLYGPKVAHVAGA